MNYFSRIKAVISEYGVWTGIAKILVRLIYKVNWTIVDKLMRITLKVKDERIIFESGSDFSDNARALYDYLIQNGYNDQYQLIWLVENPKKFEMYKKKNVVFIKKTGAFHGYYTMKALYYARTSKRIFFTHSLAWLKQKSKNQIIINLWHGCGYKASKGENKTAFFDYCLVPGEIFIKTKMQFFGCSADKILALGYPRYKWLKSANLSIPQYLTGLSKNDSQRNKTIIWMPTFRKSECKSLCENTLDTLFDIPIITSDKDFESLDTFCKKFRINLIIKRHRRQLEYNIGTIKSSNIFFLNDEQLVDQDIQLYELLAYVDGLITDYSSIGFDFLLVDKPIGFTLDDYEKYKNSRGFVFENPLEYMPGNHVYSLSDLLEFIKNVAEQKDEYKEDRAKVRSVAHNETEDYCQRIIEYFKI